MPPSNNRLSELLASPRHMVMKSANSEVLLFASPDHLVQNLLMVTGFGNTRPSLFNGNGRSQYSDSCHHMSGMANFAVNDTRLFGWELSSSAVNEVSSTRVDCSTPSFTLVRVRLGMEHNRMIREDSSYTFGVKASTFNVISRSSNTGGTPRFRVPLTPGTVVTVLRVLMPGMSVEPTMTRQFSVSNTNPLSL